MLDPLLDARYHIAEARLARDTEALAHYATEAAQYIQDNLADPAIAVVAEAWRRSFAIDRIAGTALAGILIGTVRDAVGYAHELAVELSETLIAAGDSEELRRADEAIRAEHDPAARVALLWRLAKGILP
jgi:hypothetical protein